MKFLFMILIAMFSVFISSCKDKDETFSKEAMLIWEGETDGCGFFFEIENQRFKAENEEIIPNEFKSIPQAKVKIKFEYLNRNLNYICGIAPTQHQIAGIKIHSIEKR